GGVTSVVETFDPVANTWGSAASLLTSRFQAAAVTLGNNKIYVISGRGGPYGGGTISWLNYVDEFDPVNLVWTQKTGINTARITHAAVVVNDVVYVIGGSDSNGAAVTSVEQGVRSAAPLAAISSNSSAFGAVPVRSIAERTLTVENTGNAPLTLACSLGC